MRVKDYTTAVCELVDSGKKLDDVLYGLRATLARHMRSSLYPAILRDLQKHFLRQKLRETTTVIVAREQDIKKFESDIAKAVKEIGGKVTHTRIDPHIVGGYITESHGKHIDASYKKRLLTLYRSLTS